MDVLDVSDPAEVPLIPTGEPSSTRPGADLAADDRPVHRLVGRLLGLDTSAAVALAIDVVVLIAAVGFVLVQLGPDLLVADTTPAGGDMGAHVWGPAYLRDELLSDGRLAGWAPDWYAGFPAYHFYMVVPALLIVALDAGWDGWAALVPAAAAVGLLAVAALYRRERPRVPARWVRRGAFVAAVAVTVLGCGLPYGVAFKWVSVAGLLALPVVCYAATRLADVPFPAPAVAAAASLVFLVNKQPTDGNTGTIIGGNLTSTLAGEFSFSLSLALAILYLGFLLRGLRTGGHRATCAVLLGLTALCHVIPAIYAAGATAIAVLVSIPWDRTRWRWFLPITPIAVAISAFWIGPFVLRRAYLNDMGWEKIPAGITEVPLGDFLFSVWTDAKYEELRQRLLNVLAPSQLQPILVLALVGTVVSIVLRVRLGVFLALCTVATVVAFIVTPQGRLWNARLLPFYFLCICLLAGLAVAELGRAIGSLTARRDEGITGAALATPIAASFVVWVFVGLQLGVLPGVTRTVDNTGGFDYEWAFLRVDNDDRSPVRDWARWNYTGYERKAYFPDYHDLIAMGQRIGDDPGLGCGRVMWEYEYERLNQYGTPMAPMLLPFWTDGCMGSMEGLYFEASSTTPYHFLNQRALSTNCSCAQRDLPYGSGFDIDLGVAQLQQMGVRYYFASTAAAVAAASQHPDLTEIDSTGAWHAYLVADSALVEPLAYEPVVITGLEPGMSWVGPATKWWQDPSRWDVPLADDGPPEWPRVAACTAPEPDKPAGVAAKPTWTRIDACTPLPATAPLPNVEVSGLEVGTDRIAFDVSGVGVPVVVKASYFPNWRVSGADGPYRITPNHMVVIPTDSHVELTYGWTTVDVGSYALSGVGVLGAVALARRPGRRDEEDTYVWLDGPEPILLRPPEPPEPEPGEGVASVESVEPSDPAEPAPDAP